MRRLRRVGLHLLGVLAGLSALIAAGCTVNTPLRGPGPGRSASEDAAPETVILAMTHARLERSKRGPFDDYTWRVADAMDQHEGLILYSVGKELLGDQAWTLTVWRDEASLDRFATSRAHVRAIDAGRPAIQRFQSRILEIPVDSVPQSWQEAFDLVDARAAPDAEPFPRMRRWFR